MQNFRKLHQPTDRTIVFQDQRYLFFGGTAYLGLLANAEYIELFKKGIDIYGLNNGTSRSNNVQLGVYDEAEEALAKRFNFNASAMFSSGYLAAQAAVQVISKLGKVYYAPNAHPALWLGVNPQSNCDSFSKWVDIVIDEINDSKESDFVIITNSLDNLKPELYDFTKFSKIDKSKNIILILDDSHGIGVLRKNEISMPLEVLNNCGNIEIVVVASLAKGLGTDAGVVMGSADMVARVKSHPIFMGGSPASPAAMYALIHGVSIYNNSFDKLHRNIAEFSDYIKTVPTLNAVKSFPVFTSENPSLYDYLKNNNILISSFPYPLADSPLLNRIVISALHEKQDLEKLAYLLQT